MINRTVNCALLYGVRSMDPVKIPTNTRKVGEVEEVEDSLLLADIDARSGPAFDVKVFERLLTSHRNYPRGYQSSVYQLHR